MGAGGSRVINERPEAEVCLTKIMTPLVLFVGFLGSGKTTFLKNVLPQLRQRGLEPCVIINDYQNAKVDAEQLRDLAAEIGAISGDCVCCGSKDELLSTLEKFQHGPNRIVLIETNGTTDSEQLIEMLSLEPELKKFSLPIQLSVIDGQRWQKRFWHNALEREQARTASHIFLSRTDPVAEKRVAEVEKSLAEHHIRGRRVTLEQFADELVVLNQEAATGGERASSHKCGCGHDHDHGHHHHDEHEHEHGHEHGRHHHHNHGEHHFASMELGLPEFVASKTFTKMLEGLPDEVIRAKGIVRFKETPEEYFIFQKVDRTDTPQFFPAGKTPKVTTPLILFIGPNLPEEKLRTALQTLEG